MPLFLNILWRETGDDAELRRRALAGLRRYQDAVRPAPPPPPVRVAQAGQARLLRYGAASGGNAVIFVPSLINPPRVLDLSLDHSMLRHMGAAGHDVHLVDWGRPSTADAALDLAGHVTQRLVPLLAGFEAPPLVVGYCLGGTIALGLAAVRPLAAVVTMAAPWHFDAYPQADRDALAALWTSAKHLCGRLGYLPMEVMQSAFWALDPERTIRKYAAFADMAPGSAQEAAFLGVEDWANDGPPLTYAAGRDLFEMLYAANVSGSGKWAIEGRAVGEAAEDIPTLSISSATDRIVPAASSPRLMENRLLQAGHVGMVIGGRAPAMLWNPLSEWLCSHGG